MPVLDLTSLRPDCRMGLTCPGLEFGEAKSSPYTRILVFFYVHLVWTRSMSYFWKNLLSSLKIQWNRETSLHATLKVFFTYPWLLTHNLMTMGNLVAVCVHVAAIAMKILAKVRAFLTRTGFGWDRSESFCFNSCFEEWCDLMGHGSPRFVRDVWELMFGCIENCLFLSQTNP